MARFLNIVLTFGIEIIDVSEKLSFLLPCYFFPTENAYLKGIFRLNLSVDKTKLSAKSLPTLL